ncbi:YceI family protein [Rheinheimera baltica]|uniref:YceI family protein n=1 Tax=Rheinheimera baltica TaxID=67576 RepID=UPI0027401F08|nr:YceI family protein [Rheinheimera baltica]MDP5190170.1 YceI family protein [Rheinheimera baltica]
MKLAAFVLALSTFSVSAANWQLDSSQSSLHFISVKNELVAESHQFSQLSGKWDGENASVSIPISSMQTNIPIRNERIWQYVLQAEKYNSIDVKAPLKSDSIAMLTVNNTLLVDLPLTVTIAGESATLSAKLRITKLSDSVLQASTETPLMVNINSFKLGAGVAKLQELAGLKRIEPLVPVSFNVRFAQQ